MLYATWQRRLYKTVQRKEICHNMVLLAHSNSRIRFTWKCGAKVKVPPQRPYCLLSVYQQECGQSPLFLRRDSLKCWRTASVWTESKSLAMVTPSKDVTGTPATWRTLICLYLVNKFSVEETVVSIYNMNGYTCLHILQCGRCWDSWQNSILVSWIVLVKYRENYLKRKESIQDTKWIGDAVTIVMVLSSFWRCIIVMVKIGREQNWSVMKWLYYFRVSQLGFVYLQHWLNWNCLSSSMWTVNSF